jgi:hypothetical protein
MARSHFWHYLQNEEGQPVEGANISIYLAGTTSAANIYIAESGGSPVSAAPQITTRDDGYFEFWIADATETGGYTGSKFKVAWSKPGVIDDGFVDYVEVVLSSKEVDEDDQFDETKNKMVSNALAYSWERRAKVHTAIIESVDWEWDGSNYYKDITHSLTSWAPVVMVYDDDGMTKQSITSFIIQVIDPARIRIFRTDLNKSWVTIIA